MKKEVIGHVECPVCGHAHAEVKQDKNGHAFIFCPDCAAQCFTRNDYRDRKLRARMRPVTVTDTGSNGQPEQTGTDTDTPRVGAKSGTAGQAAQKSPPEAPRPKPAKKNPPAAVPAASAPKKSGGWFQPLIGRDA